MSIVTGHELLHALGLKHEQYRNDTRDYLIPRTRDDLSAIDPNTQNFGFAYDFGSVMHYPPGGNHEEGLYNLITLPRFYQQTIGQMERISFKDAAIINRIYCEDSCKGHENKCQNGGYLNPNDCTKCHCPDGYGGNYCKQLEENENCNILADESRELKSDQTAKVLKPMIGCTSAGKECRCHWRITPMPGTKVRIQFKSLNNSLICSHPCTPPYVEIKYRTDKRAQGAKLCCAASLTDLKANEYKNWIEAEKADMDIVISAHLSPKWTVPSTKDHTELRRFQISEHFWGLGTSSLPSTKAEGGTVSFWGYSKPETKEIIRVDEVHCLHYKAAGVTPPSAKRFKSLPVEEQPPMKLSPSPFLANASSLIHVFVPFDGHP
ncbi:hypothetical protein niasHS_016146 [Heterodera schachtii]|uniref:Peptidase M12A domain-containing protein n=1 Tax=Heterodera schachtii TaxID=97005 RepID=A0ABD2HQS2_HETSC